MTRAFCYSNRYNQILFFLINRGEVVVFDLFDTTNFTVIPYGMNLFLEPDFYFNETGEEIYTHYDGERMLIYLYKSMFKYGFCNLCWLWQKTTQKLNYMI